MDCVSYRVSVPGSLMLFGEHAVLHGKQAVVTAINHYLRVHLIPRVDNKIEIISSLAGPYITTLNKFKIIKPYAYVLTAIGQYLAKMECGFTLKIDADFSNYVGFGSSAAVTVAVVGVLERWLQSSHPDLKQIYRRAVLVVRLVQGFGSGADVAASVFGGVLGYKMKPVTIKKLTNILPLIAIYSGNKVATTKVVAIVDGRRQQFPKIFAKLYNAIDSCAKEALLAIKSNRLEQLGQLMNIHQGLQDALGVNNDRLGELVFSLRKFPQVYGAKISGAGLGDCVIGLGKIKKNNFSGKIDIEVSSSGLVYL